MRVSEKTLCMTEKDRFKKLWSFNERTETLNFLLDNIMNYFGVTVWCLKERR
jgi:hypothetical protein